MAAFTQGGTNPRLAAHLQSQQQVAQDRQSRASAARAQQAAGPNFRANVTADMSPEQVRFEQAKSYRDYQNPNNFGQNDKFGQSAGEVRANQANAYRESQGLPAAATGQASGGAYSAYGTQGGSQGGAFSAWSQPTSGQTPQGARQNDLSQPQGYNLWGAQAAYGASQQTPNPWQAPQSFTMPGYSQSFNTMTGQPIGPAQPSWDGNLAHQPLGNRPGPIDWTTQGMDGQSYYGQQGLQQAMAQRDAFMGDGLMNRLGQYAGGQATGAPSFDFNQMLGRANESMQNNSWQNPFSSPMAQNPMPNMGQPTYNPTPPAWGGQQQSSPSGGRYIPQPGKRDLGNDIWRGWEQGQQAPSPTITPDRRSGDYPTMPEDRPTDPGDWSRPPEADRQYNRQYAGGTPGQYTAKPTGAAQAIPPQDQGQPYRPQAAGDSLPDVPAGDLSAQAAQAQQAEMRRIDPRSPHLMDQQFDGDAIRDFQWRVANSPYGLDVEDAAPAGSIRDHSDPSNPTAKSSPRYENTWRGPANRPAAPQPTQPANDAVGRINAEIDKWERATYGTWQGSGPPQAWHDHINNLKRLRGRAMRGDADALAWRPKMQAPPPKQHAVVPVGDRAHNKNIRYDGVRRNQR